VGRLKRRPVVAVLAADADCLGSSAPARARDRAAPASTSAYVALAPKNAAVFSNLGGAGLDDPSTERIPNYLRALAMRHPAAVKPLARLVKTVLYGGTVAPETKAAMGLLIAKGRAAAVISLPT
jgi:hypothetical protein